MFSTRYDSDAKLWYGHESLPLYNPRISLAQVLLNAMNVFGPKIAQISDNNGVQLTFDEIRMKTIRAAQNLRARGYERKQVFGIVARNSQNVAPIVFASLAIGCPLNPLDTSFGKIEIIHMLSVTKPVLVFCDIECYELLTECLMELQSEAKIFTFGSSRGQSEPVESLFQETGNEHQFVPEKVDGSNDTAVIVCSSGTTGFSKGVCLSHAAVIDGTNQFNWSNCDDILLCFSSLYWISGLVTLLRGTLCGATRIITTFVFAPELQLRLIEQYRITFTFNATHQVVLMMKSEHFDETDLSSLKDMIVGGSKVPFHTKIEMKRKLPIGNVFVGYGLSEIAGAVSINYPASYDKDTVGKLSGGSCVKIVDEHGNRCGINEDGEICIKTNFKFIGYYDNPKETHDVFDEDGFIKTGDIGHFDTDGFLYVIDRKKELLKYCNFQISPSEIDAYLTESPDIETACVVGIPDSVATDLPAAVIVRAERSNITEQDVYDMVAGHFADHYKLRGGVYFVDSLPTTPSGKVQRRFVKENAIAMYKKRTA